MYKVKVFDEGKASILEENINNFLKENTSIKLIDIKFNSYPYENELSDYHSAMVIYVTN